MVSPSTFLYFESTSMFVQRCTLNMLTLRTPMYIMSLKTYFSAVITIGRSSFDSF